MAERHQWGWVVAAADSGNVISTETTKIQTIIVDIQSTNTTWSILDANSNVLVPIGIDISLAYWNRPGCIVFPQGLTLKNGFKMGTLTGGTCTVYLYEAHR